MTADEYRAIYKLLAEWLMSGGHFLLTNFTDERAISAEPQYRSAAANLRQKCGPTSRTLLLEQHGVLTRYSFQLAREFLEVFCRSALHLRAREPVLFAGLHRSSGADGPYLPPDRYRACVYSCNAGSSSTAAGSRNRVRRTFANDVPVGESKEQPANESIVAPALPPPQYTWISSPERHPLNSDYVNAVLLDSAYFQNTYATSYFSTEYWVVNAGYM